jgi:hypothetical protein
MLTLRNEIENVKGIDEILKMNSYETTVKTKLFRINPLISLNKMKKNSFEQFSSSNELYDNAFCILNLLHQYNYIKNCQSIVITKGDTSIVRVTFDDHEHEHDNDNKGIVFDIVQFTNDLKRNRQNQSSGGSMLFMIITIGFYIYTMYSKEITSFLYDHLDYNHLNYNHNYHNDHHHNHPNPNDNDIISQEMFSDFFRNASDFIVSSFNQTKLISFIKK